MKNLLLGFLGLSLLVVTSCSDDDSNVQGPADDIVTIAIDAGYNSLAAALTRADLVSTLSGEGPYTVFAPTDEQFTALLAEVGQTSIEDVPVSVLTDILLSHVVEGAITSDMLSNGNVSTLGNTSLEINVDGGITVGGIDVVEPFDVEGANGVIHTIDGVIVPSNVGQFVNTVLEPAYFNNDYTTLVAAVVEADLTNTLLTTENLTIFAPTNAAFATAGITAENVGDVEGLGDVLAYHVLTSKVLSTQIPASTPTFGGDEIFFSLVGSGNFINGDVEITAVDIESGSGVVHEIDGVLMPSAGTIVDVAVELSEGGEFTSLVAALLRTANEGTAEQDLVTVLNGEGPFTVFAPTNAAFQALLDSNNDWTGLGDIPLETLISVLTYHVVPARAFDKDLAGAIDSNSELPTAQGSKVVVNLNDLTLNTTTNIGTTNVLATNGVIHAIDEVLLPPAN